MTTETVEVRRTARPAPPRLYRAGLLTPMDREVCNEESVVKGRLAPTARRVPHDRRRSPQLGPHLERRDQLRVFHDAGRIAV